MGIEKPTPQTSIHSCLAYRECKATNKANTNHPINKTCSIVQIKKNLTENTNFNIKIEVTKMVIKHSEGKLVCKYGQSCYQAGSLCHFVLMINRVP